jgi:hypothetical protein
MVVYYTVLLFMAFVSSASAGVMEYYCTVKQVLKLSDDGKIVVNEVASPVYVGKDFRISRKTGVISSGVPFSSFEKMRVLFPGSSEHSFVGLAADEDGPFPIASLIEIHEFVPGPVKPFLWHIRGADLYSGTCL